MSSFYQDEIRTILAAAGDLPRVEPRIIEAWMRVEHGTLDALTARQFREEVVIATFCARDAGDDANERLARSYGL